MRDGDIISLLLRDFNGDERDWLWETDIQGCMCGENSSMAQKLEIESGMPLATALSRTCPAGSGLHPDAGWDVLERRFHSASPFMDLAVKVWVDGVLRWWALTARPLHDNSGWIGVARDITTQKKHLDEIEQQAYFDPLTGMRSRFSFQKSLTRRLATYPGKPLALLHLDLNGFKAVNNIHGYPTGDAVIREVGNRLLAFDDSHIVTARLGGDDFVVFLDLPASEALPTAHAMLDSLRKPFFIHQKQLDLSVCAGLTYSPDHGQEMQQLFQNVAFALAAAKDAGPSTICAYEAAYGDAFMRRVRTIHEIKSGLDLAQFELWYQPQIDVSSCCTVGAEALIRWRHPQRGMISPLEFIPLAEQSGQIVALGTWVLFRACAEASKWPADWKVSVNVAPAQLQEKGFLDIVRKALASSSLEPTRLKLEITESALVDGSTHIRDTLTGLRALNICVSLDDFGTGYSSLSYLRQFPFNELKIDQSFVRSMVESDESMAIVEAILQLARTLRLTTTAEGVETPVQASLLREIGCDRYQGYLYGKPMPHSQFMEIHAGRPDALVAAN